MILYAAIRKNDDGREYVDVRTFSNSHEAAKIYADDFEAANPVVRIGKFNVDEVKA
jgi:hypothetical protein